MDEWSDTRIDFDRETAGKLRTGKAPFTVEPLTLLDASDVESYVLQNAGAELPVRDGVDNRIIKQYKSGAGNIIMSQDDVGGYL